MEGTLTTVSVQVPKRWLNHVVVAPGPGDFGAGAPVLFTRTTGNTGKVLVES